MPSRVGPRHAGQSEAGSTAAEATLTVTTSVMPARIATMKLLTEVGRIDVRDLSSGFTRVACAGSYPVSSCLFPLTNRTVEPGGQGNSRGGNSKNRVESCYPFRLACDMMHLPPNLALEPGIRRNYTRCHSTTNANAH